jgi:hypothetical protein
MISAQLPQLARTEAITGINSAANQAGRPLKKRKDPMNDLTAADHDDAMLFFDLSDETIEMAAGSVWKAGALTLAFCSGINSYPSASA